jgi:hypothetical protein
MTAEASLTWSRCRPLRSSQEKEQLCRLGKETSDCCNIPFPSNC